MSKKTKPEAEEQEQVKTEAPAEETAKADAKTGKPSITT